MRKKVVNLLLIIKILKFLSRKQFLLLPTIFIFIGCSLIKKPAISYEFIEIPNSDYTLVRTKTYNEIDSVICKRILIKVDLDTNDYVQTNLWIPKDTIKAKNKLCLLIPPFMNNTLIMYPIAVKLLKRNIPVVFLSYRGVEGDKMENFEKSYGVKEINDGIYILDGVAKYLNYDSLRCVIYGVSLGGAIAINIVDNYPDIKGLVVEALPYDFEKTANKMFTKEELDGISQNINFKQVEAFQPKHTIPKLDTGVAVFGVWATHEKYIIKEDIDSLVELFKNNKIHFSYYLVNSNAHHFRYGYPLSRQESDSLDGLIVDFILKSINN